MSAADGTVVFLRLLNMFTPLVYLLIELLKAWPDYLLGYYSSPNSKTSRGIKTGACLLVYTHNLEENALQVQSLPCF